jgi:type II secretory pathway component GspD/PulD (secretin)
MNNLIAHRPRLWTVERGRIPLLCAIAFCALTSGCKVYPDPNRKTIDELYMEALTASQKRPEYTLGANPAVGPQTLTESPSTPALPASPESEIRLPAVPDVPPVPPEMPQDIEVPIDLPPIEPIDPPSPRNPGSLTPEFTNPGDANSATSRATTSVQHSTEIWRKRSEPVKAEARISAPVKTVAFRANSTEPATVSEQFEETDIRQALQVLATQAGVTVIVDEQVSGTITTLIENDSFDVALRKVLMPLGLVSRRIETGEYIVAAVDPSSPLFSKVSDRMEYRPTHVSPDELLKLLPQREARFVSVVDKRNLMIVEAPTEIADPILLRLREADSPIPQVELEAIVCVIAPDRGFKAGLDWNHAVTLNGSEVLKFGMAGLAFNGQGSGQGANNAFSNFAVTAAFVKLLAQEGYLSIRAAPRVTARDGEPAKISITRQSFFSVQPASDNQFFRQELEEVEAGITMEITPIIRGDNITVKIDKAEVSEDIRTTDVNQNVANNPYPLINRRTVSTTVNVKDAETIVIGGLVQRQTVDRIGRVPVLGSIPYAGRLFQTVEHLEQDAEVVIFISPRIVTSGPACTPNILATIESTVPQSGDETGSE